MKFSQIPSTHADLQTWGRCVNGYGGSAGTGSRIDPDYRDVGIDGHLSFQMLVEEWELRDLWQKSNLNTDSPESMWHRISEYPKRYVLMDGYKFRRGFFKSDAWVGPLRFYFMTEEISSNHKQVNVGFLGGTTVLELFARFDHWREGKYPASLDLEMTIERAA